MFSLTEQQYSFLESESQRLGVPIAELVRRIIDAYRGVIPSINVPVKKSKRSTDKL
jgi:hypothetical protein